VRGNHRGLSKGLSGTFGLSSTICSVPLSCGNDQKRPSGKNDSNQDCADDADQPTEDLCSYRKKGDGGGYIGDDMREGTKGTAWDNCESGRYNVLG
jgi:hypothetical protein